MDLLFNIDNTKISLQNEEEVCPLLVGGNTDYICSFTFSSEWDGLVKTVVFYNNKSQVEKPEILEDDICAIPYEVLTHGELDIGVTGTDGDATIKTAMTYRLSVCRTIIDNMQGIDPPSRGVYEQVIALVASIDGQSINTIYLNQNDELVYRKKNGEEINCGRITADDDEPLPNTDIDTIINEYLEN